MHPINSKNFGASGVQVFYYNGSALATGYVVKQTGTSRYVVTTDGNTTFVVSLAQTAALAGRLDGTSPLGTASDLVGLATMTLTVASATKYVVKLTGSAAVTADGSTYSWTLGTPAGSVYALTVHVPVTPLVNTAVPTITGTAKVGQVLTASTGTWTGSPTGYSYVWKANAVAISGATSSTYTPVTGDIGSVITVVVTASKTGTASVYAISAATAAVVA